MQIENLTLFQHFYIKGVSSDDLKVAALTTRQINSICTSLHLYHFVVICAVEQMTTFQSVLEKHFDSVEIAFLYDKSEEGKATTTGEIVLSLSSIYTCINHVLIG